jgi:hypothetical protein
MSSTREHAPNLQADRRHWDAERRRRRGAR